MPREHHSRSPSEERTRKSSSRHQGTANDGPTAQILVNPGAVHPHPPYESSIRSRSRSRERSSRSHKEYSSHGNHDDKYRSRDKHRDDDRRGRSSRHHRSRSSSYSSRTGSRSSSSSSSSRRHHHRHRHGSSKHHKHDRKDKKERKSKKDSRHRSRSPDDPRHDRHHHRTDTITSDQNPSTTTASSSSSSSSSSSRPISQPLPSSSSSTTTHSIQQSENRILGMFGYTAENNPYGDPNLNTPFLWGKKVQKDITIGKATAVPTSDELLQKRDAMMDEIERARERRSKREAEREEMERLRAEEARLKDANQYAGWEEKEEEFHRAQVRTRILIRVKEQRERISDSLVKNPMVLTAILDGKDMDEPFLLTEIQLRPPLRTIQNCYHIKDLESIVNDIRDVQEYEGPNGLHSLYWSVILDVVQDEIRRRKVREIGLKAGRTLASLQAVEEEIDAMFEGQNEDSLDDMEKQVRNTLNSATVSVASHLARGSDPATTSTGGSGGGAIDVEYWEGVLKNLQIARSKTILQRLHEELIMKRLTQMESIYARQQGLADIPRLDTLVIPRDTAGRRSFIAKKLELLRQAGMMSTLAYYEGESTNATDGSSSSSTSKESMIPEGEDASFMDEKGRILPTGNAESAMGEDLEVVLPSSSSSTSATTSSSGNVSSSYQERYPDYDPLREKFRPRKPRYFNRIKTGYDWNRYNQAHYDRDNPPPKTVQGYKFNIFYPDLLDRTKTPSFHLEPADTDDYVLIRFHGGPPYEDIAFKIVNREWDRGKKSGFRSTFDRGILQLYFNFRRYRYRK